MAAPDRYPFEALLREFDRIVTSAQATIIAQIEAAIRAGDLQAARNRQVQLAAVDATLQQLAAAANPLAARAVHDAWQQGAQRALQQVQALPIQTAEDTRSFAGVSREAVEQMQTSLLQKLDVATQTLGRRVEDIYGREQRHAALRAILGANGSVPQASRDLQQRLLRDRHIRRAVEDGRTGFVDSAGRRWSLDIYSNMAVRTVTREAVVQGAITRMVSHGITVGRVSTHPDACEICKPFEGTLIDLAGSGITEYRGEAVSTNPPPPFHPNCAHSIMPVAATIDQLRAEQEAVTA